MAVCIVPHLPHLHLLDVGGVTEKQGIYLSFSKQGFPVVIFVVAVCRTVNFHILNQAVGLKKHGRLNINS